MKRFPAVACGVLLAVSCYGATLRNSLTTSVKGTSCSTPAAVVTFLPTDKQVWAYFSVGGAASEDVVKVEFYSPKGSLVSSVTPSVMTSGTTACYWASMDLAGTSTDLGMYTAKVIWNDAPLTSMSFWVQNPGLTMEQKLFDFQVIASLYAKRYAPYDWKKTLFHYDALDLKPWLEKVMATKDDLDYLEILVQYVAALNDTHCSYRISSTYTARLGFGVDVYYDDTGKNYSILIDSITRSSLPASTYPFEIGDELVSIDGVKVADLMEGYKKFISAASPESGLRRAADYLTYRSQSGLPKAHQIGSTATVEIKRQSGNVEKYTVPWIVSGIPLTRVGPVPMPRMTGVRTPEEDLHGADLQARIMAPLMKFRNEKDDNVDGLLNYGSLTPVWNRPEGFVQRLGRSSTDNFFTGVMTARNHTVGYLRIPHFSPTSESAALKQLETEIAYFQDNTEGLVVDVMRNNGGAPCFGEQVLRRLIPNDWKALGRRIRPVWDDIISYQYSLMLARTIGTEQATVDLLQARLNDLRTAYEAGRDLTGAVSTCAEGLDRTPASVVYSKPILLLTDEFSTSAADGFAAQFQDNKRGKLFGNRTNGAGGGVLTEYPGYYSEGGSARVLVSMHWRPNPITTAEYPAANYIENVGVRPDIPFNYMTAANLKQNGRLFVDAFLEAIAAEIEKAAATAPATQ